MIRIVAIIVVELDFALALSPASKEAASQEPAHDEQGDGDGYGDGSKHDAIR